VWTESLKVRDGEGVHSFSSLPLYWRVCSINALVFLVGTIILVVSPATVSPQVSTSELGVLAVGLVLIMGLNALLLHSSLAPVDRLISLMQRVNSERSGQRLPEAGDGSVRQLVESFNAMMSRLELERAQSNAEALAVQEAERHRIAQELHDEIGQGLTVVLLGLKRVVDSAPAGLAEELQLVQETARASLDEVREVARRLRPGVLEDLGLVSALTALAAEFSAHGGSSVRRDIGSTFTVLSEETELVVYRVAQEALTNAARHAHADLVQLSLHERSDGVELRVIDNGRGLQGSREGAGIRGMRERALLVGGDLTITTPNQRGTEVRLHISNAAQPLRQERRWPTTGT
jgi:two-component system sensor histidine kinase UhpB